MAFILTLLRKFVAVVVGLVCLVALLAVGAFFYGVIKFYLWSPAPKPAGERQEPRP